MPTTELAMYGNQLVLELAPHTVRMLKLSERLNR